MFDEAAASRRVFEAVGRQVDLARTLDVTPAAISNLKKRHRCTLPLVIGAAKLTGRTVEWFIFGEERSRPVVADGEAPYGPSRTTARLDALDRRLAKLEQRMAKLERSRRKQRRKPRG
jgi:hypothetical protein